MTAEQIITRIIFPEATQNFPMASSYAKRVAEALRSAGLLREPVPEGAPTESLAALIAPILARIDPEKIATHGPDCYQWHVECLALSVNRRLSEGAPREEQITDGSAKVGVHPPTGHVWVERGGRVLAHVYDKADAEEIVAALTEKSLRARAAEIRESLRSGSIQHVCETRVRRIRSDEEQGL